MKNQEFITLAVSPTEAKIQTAFEHVFTLIKIDGDEAHIGINPNVFQAEELTSPKNELQGSTLAYNVKEVHILNLTSPRKVFIHSENFELKLQRIFNSDYRGYAVPACEILISRI